MFAEFERSSTKKAENGEALTSHFLKEAYRELTPPIMAKGWLWMRKLTWNGPESPTFNDAFYVYSMPRVCPQLSLWCGRSSPKGSLQWMVISLSSKGGSDYPLNLLQDAGVDIGKPTAGAGCHQPFSGLLDEMEGLI